MERIILFHFVVVLEMSTVGSSSGKRNSSKSGHVEGTESWPLVLPVVVAVVVGIVAIILVLLLVYLRRKRFLLDRNPKRCAKNCMFLICIEREDH